MNRFDRQFCQILIAFLIRSDKVVKRIMAAEELLQPMDIRIATYSGKKIKILSKDFSGYCKFSRGQKLTWFKINHIIHRNNVKKVNTFYLKKLILESY